MVYVSMYIIKVDASISCQLSLQRSNFKNVLCNQCSNATQNEKKLFVYPIIMILGDDFKSLDKMVNSLKSVSHEQQQLLLPMLQFF